MHFEEYRIKVRDYLLGNIPIGKTVDGLSYPGVWVSVSKISNEATRKRFLDTVIMLIQEDAFFPYEIEFDTPELTKIRKKMKIVPSKQEQLKKEQWTKKFLIKTKEKLQPIPTDLP